MTDIDKLLASYVHMSSVPMCFTNLRAFASYIPTCLRASVSYMLSCLRVCVSYMST